MTAELPSAGGEMPQGLEVKISSVRACGQGGEWISFQKGTCRVLSRQILWQAPLFQFGCNSFLPGWGIWRHRRYHTDSHRTLNQWAGQDWSGPTPLRMWETSWQVERPDHTLQSTRIPCPSATAGWEDEQWCLSLEWTCHDSLVAQGMLVCGWLFPVWGQAW